MTRSSYTYNEVNAIGQRKKLTTAFDLGTGITSNGGETNWDYGDGLGHLTKADAPGTIADRSFEYDHIGNRKKSAESLTLPGTDNYVSNALNQYTAVGAFSPGYDDDGNQTTAQIKPITATTPMTSLFAWDGSNQLAEVKDDVSTSRVKYRYDALSRRIARILPDGSITHYLYDEWNCIAEYAGSTTTAATLARKRTWGLDLSGQQQGAGGVGGLLSETHGTTPYFATYDGNGNVSEYLNADGSTAAHFEYDAFGNTVVTANPSGVLFGYRFSTKPTEPLTGLYYYGYRWYDPMTGKWPSRDPIEEEGGLNLYGFVLNEPNAKIDPLGLIANNRPVLQATESKAFAPGACGAFSWAVKWSVSPKSNNIGGGAVLQEISISWDVEDCNGQKLNLTVNGGKSKKEFSSPINYFEAWGVAPDSTTVRIDSGIAGDEDTFAFPGFKVCTKGKITFIGYARYYPNNDLVSLPGSWSTGWGFTSGDLWSGSDRPDWPTATTSRSSLVKHSIVVKWNCCPTVKPSEKIYSTIETIPGS